ncbi:zf-HC2 domain-containing protein [Phytohabitans sp. ZYX-F-186]|uniref:Zf-HC2 domain-containing protein n=1 Tax=Phytohabitans maris TaxID=3071409 RepID=A0ABU0ZBF8_9ACTN|nr:zf-HC2 domain-containing protein [Phytohabitans sp. ZYX-F-186]MDQ7904392.1 zf-HC2 domain-containing protein [Phytohabitans sp. ZYX-F-186]
MNENLIEYATGALDPAGRAEVEAHLAGCAGCRADVAAWRSLAAAVEPPAPPGPELVHRVLLRSALDGPPPPTRRPAWLSLALLRAEARLVRPVVPIASALAMALGVVLAAASPQGLAGQVLALVAPFVAALGIAGLYGPRRDPAFEVVAAAPTAPALILLARIALIFGYDLLLALAASGVLAALGGDPGGVFALVDAWLGPMALLSALTLVLAVRVGADVAAGAALMLWSLRVLAGGLLADVDWALDAVRLAWSTNAGTVLAAAALTALAVVFAGRGEPIRHHRATHLA